MVKKNKKSKEQKEAKKQTQLKTREERQVEVQKIFNKLENFFFILTLAFLTLLMSLILIFSTGAFAAICFSSSKVFVVFAINIEFSGIEAISI